MSSSEQLDRIAVDGYEYFYPLVLMDLTRRLATSLPAGAKPGFGPANAFTHMREFPPGDFKEVVRPNFDTLYSITWLDLTNEPQVVSVTEPVDRYFLLPILDMWTDVFAVIGTRTTGNGVGDYAIVPPGWSGAVPDGVATVRAPTSHAWIVGRTQTNGPSDYETVHRFQNGFRVAGLSTWPEANSPEPSGDSSYDTSTPPMDRVHAMSGAEFFSYASDLLAGNPPHLTDQPILARLKSLGFVAGQHFSIDGADQVTVEAIDRAPKVALTRMESVQANLPIINGWSTRRSDIGVYGTNYLYRATIAMMGLGANLPEDAIYPVISTDDRGSRPEGANDYLLHFDPDEIPPVDAFWSVTMYDGAGFPVPNDTNRYALGDRDPLAYNVDGSLDIYISRADPGPERSANWLPAPNGPLGITLRLYLPKPEVLDGRWNPPPLRRL